MSELYEYQKKIIKEIEGFIKTAEVESYELTDAFKEHSKNNPDPDGIDFAARTWLAWIHDSKSVASVDKMKGWILEVVNNLAKMKREKAKEEKKQGDQKKKDEADWWKDYYKENADYWQKSSQWWRDNNKTPESPKEERNPNLPKEDSFDDRCKREYIEETERELKKKDISDSQLNNALGVDDWRAEMNKSSGWRTAQTFSFSINDAIKKMSSQIVCDMCKETASPIIDYIVFDKKENKKKKFCSWECSSAWRDKNKGIDQDEAKEIKKEIKELKDYIQKSNENVNNVLNNLLSWVKKGGIVNIALSEDKLVVEFKNKETKTIKESDLNSEQRTLKNYLQSSSDKKSVSRSELEKMVGGDYNEEGGKDKKSQDGKIGMIAAIVGVGLVLAVIIGVVVYKNKKKDY